MTEKEIMIANEVEEAVEKFMRHASGYEDGLHCYMETEHCKVEIRTIGKNAYKYDYMLKD